MGSISRSRNQQTACHSRAPSRQSSETEHLRRGRLFLPALRHDRITAPCVIDGPINSGSFRAYVEQFLVTTLSSGDVVVMIISAATRARACTP
jgi:hypothetical protein